MMTTTKKLVRISLLAAFGVLLMATIAFPLPLFPNYLTYDPGDVPALIAAFAMGPWTGVMVQLVKGIVAFLIGASKAGPLGMTANFIAGGTMVLVAGLIYQYRKTKLTSVLAAVIGCVVTSLVMIPVNYFWLCPAYGYPPSSFMATSLIIGLFNLVKFVFCFLLTYPIYKKVRAFLEEDDMKSAAARADKYFLNKF
jgi:riboflavin transporter FmnP